MKSNLSLKYILVAIMFFLLPNLIGYQPYLPKILQQIVVYSRLIVFAVFIFYFLRSSVNFFLLILFGVYILILLLVNEPSDYNYWGILSMSLISSIAYFKFGNYLSFENKNNHYFKFLIYGLNAFNISTLVFYYLLGNGTIDLNNFFEITGKDNVELFRFSVGNPIEIPLFITALLYTSIKLLPSNSNHLFSTSLNLIVTLISQSRIMVIIAVLIFLREILKSDKRVKIAAITIIILGIPFLKQQFGEETLSFFDRLGGNDSGSADDRTFLFQTFLKNLNGQNLMIGSGLTSSLDLIKSYTGEYRTIESVLIQILYELGILGTLLFFANLVIGKNKLYFPVIFDLVIILMYVQMFLFLPIFSFMPFVFLLFGVCCKETDLIKNRFL